MTRLKKGAKSFIITAPEDRINQRLIVTNCTSPELNFSPLSRKKIVASFSGGSISSNAGILLFREIDKRLNLTQRISALIPDQRNAAQVEHSVISMIKQRVFGIGMAYEDLNDHTQLRKDDCVKIAAEVENDLASASTLCRFENTITEEMIWKLNELLLDIFLEHYGSNPPKEIIIDFDGTDFFTHGEQELFHFNSYYDHECFMPLYAFSGDHLIGVMLRPSSEDGAWHSWGFFALMVKRIRNKWKDTQIIFRADGGFCRDDMLTWCERKGISFIVGMAKNAVLLRGAKTAIAKAKALWEETQKPVKVYAQFEYAAKSWKLKRTMVGRVEYNHHGENVRFIATNMKGHSSNLYESAYCGRGDMENKIKQQKLDLRAGRVSCHVFTTNWFRVLLSGFAYVLLTHLKLKLLKNSKLKNAYVGTIRAKLLKIGAVIIKNTRRIRILMESHFPEQNLFASILRKLHPA
jgi:hypothetical protein